MNEEPSIKPPVIQQGTPKLNDIKFIFVSIYREDIEKYKKVFDGYSEYKVEFVNDYISHLLESVDCDAVVSTSDSFGFMTGNVNQKYIELFGSGLRHCIQKIIKSKYHGELIVGRGLIAALETTEKQKVRYVINAPTKRVPGDISNSLNVYYAFRAVLDLLESRKHDISCVVVPCMGTGTGRMHPTQSAKQVKMAMDAFAGVESESDEKNKIQIADIVSSASWSVGMANEYYLRCSTLPTNQRVTS